MSKNKRRRALDRLHKQFQKKSSAGGQNRSSQPHAIQCEKLARHRAGLPPKSGALDPLFLDGSALHEQLRVLLKKPTDELERLAKEGGGSFSLRLIYWVIDRQNNPPQETLKAIANITAERPSPRKLEASSKGKDPGKKGKHKGIASQKGKLAKGGALQRRHNRSCPTDADHAESDWWRESGE